MRSSLISIGELAADAAIGADAVDLAFGGVRHVEHARLVDEALLHQRAGRAGLHALAAGDAGRGAHRVVEVEDDLLEMPARRHADDVVDLDLAAGADAEIAVDAGVELHRHRRMAEIVGLVYPVDRREAALRHRDAVGPAPESGVRIVRGRALGLVGDEELEDELARGRGALARGLDLHARRRPAHAGGGEHALALDLDHAGAAIAVGPVAGRGGVAEVRDVGAVAARHLPDGLARPRLDLAPVEDELDAFDDRQSVGHTLHPYLNIVMAGLEPAIPVRQAPGSSGWPGQARP